MGYITRDEYGIPNKKIYDCIAREFKKGLFAPRRIDEDLARVCTELNFLTTDEIANLDFLSFFPNLEELTVESANLSDIQGLRLVPNLTWLAISNHALSDISPLDCCRKLTFLQLEASGGKEADKSCEIWDYRVLGRLGELTTLSLEGNNISDISWITGLRQLKDVVLCHNPIVDFTPLLQLPALEVVEADPGQSKLFDERFAHLAIHVDD